MTNDTLPSVVPVELIDALAAERPAPAPKSSSAPAAKNGHAKNGHAKNGHTNGRHAGRPSAVDRCRAYLAKLPGAVAGQRGHDRLYQAARIAEYDFDVPREDGIPLLIEWNATCDPPWDERDIERKWDESVKAGSDDRGRGWRLIDAETADGVRSPGPGCPPPTTGPAASEFEPPVAGEDWNNPHRIARAFAARYLTPDGKSAIVQWRGGYHLWSAAAFWLPAPDDDLRAALARHCRTVFEDDLPARRAEAPPDKPAKLLPVTGRLISDTLLNLAGIVNLPDTRGDAPFWLGDRGNRPDPAEVLAAPNGLFTLDDIAAGRPAFSPPTPEFFTPNALTFSVPATRAAARADYWRAALSEWFNGDPASIAGLQEWFGYLLSAITAAHKILMLVGPPRSGKGTILRVLTALVGEGNVASTSFARLGESFGLESLLGKRVALIPDGRMSGRADTAAAVERLLSVSGEDDQSVNRKNRPVLTTRLRVRFVIASNEVPRLPDAAGAVASRFDILRTPNSYLGREDRGLADRLLAELPGILLWAAEGWCRLKANGLRFTPNTAAVDYVRQLEDLSSPIRAFVRERCAIGPEREVDVHDLYTAWRRWNEEQNRNVSSEQIFGRDLKAAVPQVVVKQPRRNGRQVRVYGGIGLRVPGDWGEQDAAADTR